MEWVDKLGIKPTQPQFELQLKLGLSLAIYITANAWVLLISGNDNQDILLVP